MARGHFSPAIREILSRRDGSPDHSRNQCLNGNEEYERSDGIKEKAIHKTLMHRSDGD
jgi:hypothetical protein